MRECHHIALLIGYGAAAVNPYLAIESVRDLVRRNVIAGDPRLTENKAEANLLKALGKGLLKIMSKMGVSAVASYTGAQIFEAIGLGPEVIEHLLRGHHLAAVRRGLRRAGRGDPAADPATPARRPRGWRYRRLEGRRRVPVAARRGAAPVQPGDGVQAAARDRQPQARDLQAVRPWSTTSRGGGRRCGPAAHPRRRSRTGAGGAEEGTRACSRLMILSRCEHSRPGRPTGAMSYGSTSARPTRPSRSP